MAKILALCLLATSLPVLVAGQKAYEGYEILSVRAKTQDDVSFLQSFQKQYIDLDFLTAPSIYRNFSVLAPPTILGLFKSQAKEHGIDVSVAISDVDSHVEKSFQTADDPESLRRSAAGGLEMSHSKYYTYLEISQYLDLIAMQYPSLAQVFSLDYRTYEGTEIRAIKISTGGSPKKSIVMEFGIHAREWISPATAVFFIDALTSGYDMGDPAAGQMLDNFDWYIIPVANPDGYQFSWGSGNRFWRKNRRRISGSCNGVDLNRNFNSKWGTVGVDHNCRSDIYPGSYAFSEAETSGLRDLVYSLRDSIHAYISVHAYSQVLLVPWGNVNGYSRPPNAAALDRVGVAMVQELMNTHGKFYEYGTAFDLLGYAASGAAEDWALEAYPGIYAYCYELRPEWVGGSFILSPDQIIPQGDEFYRSISRMAQMI